MVEIVHKKSGDQLNIYEPENGAWFFFSYSRGLLQTIASAQCFQRRDQQAEAGEARKQR